MYDTSPFNAYLLSHLGCRFKKWCAISFFMNSKQRKEARYQRRMAKRKAKRENHFARYDKVENLASLNKLKKSVKECSSGVAWKTSIQRYDYNYLYYITKARKEILEGKNISKGFICFTLCERGKVRNIKAVRIEERVIQKTLCREILMPCFKKYLIYDNGACIKGKGCSFALARTTKQLVDYYKHNGTDGYILQFDIKSYFDSIPLDVLNEMLLKDFKDELVRNVITSILFSFKKYGDYGIGLGSEVSQICAVYYMNPVDHYAKDVKGIKPYNRYMDDGYAILKTRQEAVELKKELEEFLKPFGIRFNEAKTQIHKLSEGFKFLKVRFILTDSGKVIRILDSKRFVRQRRKTKKYRKFVDEGVMDIDDVCLQMTSVIRTMKHCHNYHAKKNLQTLFNDEFKNYGRKMKINGRIKKY